MATRLYFHAANSGVSNLPTTNQSALSPTTTQGDAFNINRSMDRTQGVSTSTFRTCLVDGTSTLKSYYFTRFVSEQLRAQTITSQTWVYNFGARENSLSINFPCSGANQVVYICVYVYRPGTGKVFTIYEGNSSADADEPAAADNAYSEHVTFSGTSGSIQDNDVICQEIWFRIDPASFVTNMQMIFVYDGDRTPILSSGTSISTSLNYAAFLETPQNLSFMSDPPPEINATSDYKDILRQRPQTLITNSI